MHVALKIPYFDNSLFGRWMPKNERIRDSVMANNKDFGSARPRVAAFISVSDEQGEFQVISTWDET